MQTPIISPGPSSTLGILLAGLLEADRTADRWEVARAPTTSLTRRRGLVLLVPRRAYPRSGGVVSDKGGRF